MQKDIYFTMDLFNGFLLFTKYYFYFITFIFHCAYIRFNYILFLRNSLLISSLSLRS